MRLKIAMNEIGLCDDDHFDVFLVSFTWKYWLFFFFIMYMIDIRHQRRKNYWQKKLDSHWPKYRIGLKIDGKEIEPRRVDCKYWKSRYLKQIFIWYFFSNTIHNYSMCIKCRKKQSEKNWWNFHKNFDRKTNKLNFCFPLFFST